MTTRLSIMNHGPDAIAVVMPHDEGGCYYVIEKDTEKDFYVHAAQSLEIHELGGKTSE